MAKKNKSGYLQDFDFYDDAFDFDTGFSDDLDTGIDVSAPTTDYIQAGTDFNIMPGLKPNQLRQSDSKFTNFSIANQYKMGKAAYDKFEDMVKANKLKDRSGNFSLSGAAGLALGVTGLGSGRVGTTPVGKKMHMGVPVLSDAVMKKHYSNYAKTKAALANVRKTSAENEDLLQLDAWSTFAVKPSDTKITSFPDLHKSTSTGFYANFHNLQISRDPSKPYYDGALHNFGPNAHNTFKAFEAIGKGLDPAGYKLDGKNQDNNGGRSNSSGTAMITEDGYYTWADFSSEFGYKKSVLYGAGDESADMAKSLGVSVDEMIAAMKIARSDSGVTFSQALKGVTGKNIDTGKARTTNTFTTNIKGVGAALKDVGSNVLAAGQSAYTALENKLNQLDDKIGDVAYNVSQTPLVQNIAQGAMTVDENINKIVENVVNKEEPKRNAGAGTKWKNQVKEVSLDQNQIDSISKANKAAGFSGFGRHGFNTGGQVSSPVGQLASMLRSNRLGYNQGGAVQSGYYGYQDGGEVNLQEVGFINGQTPSDIPEQQTIADNRSIPAESEDFIINAASVEMVGEDMVMGLLSEAIERASNAGVQIVDMPVDIPQENLQEIFVSDGEVKVPNELVPYVVEPPSQEQGLNLLNRINEVGKEEIDQRVAEQGSEPMQQTIPADNTYSMVSPEERDIISERQLQEELQV